MMIRLLRSGKWELLLFFIASSATATLAYYAIHQAMNYEGLSLIGLAGISLLVNIAFGYWIAQRMQRRIDALHLALKQAANHNFDVKLPEAGARAFESLYKEFNVMASSLSDRLRVLQQVGEKSVLREAESNEAAVLEERKRLARDLHDSVSQQLFAIHMSAAALPKLQQLNPDKAADVIEQLIHMSSMAQKQMRGFIAQLRPLELENRSLQEALDKWFPDYCRQNGLQGSLDWRLQDELTEAKEYQLFLIIQEAMANVVKHAKARHVSLLMAETERQYSMVLQDDGVGFKADQVKMGSYGLSTMQERARKIGGDAEILSKPGSGTRIKITIPKYAAKEQT